MARAREGVRGGSSCERSYSSPRAVLAVMACAAVLGFALRTVVRDVEEGGDLHGTYMARAVSVHGTPLHAWLMQCGVCAVLTRCTRTERVTCEKLTQVDAVAVSGAEAAAMPATVVAMVAVAVAVAEAEAEAGAEAVVVAVLVAVVVALGRGSSSSVTSGGRSSHMAESR